MHVRVPGGDKAACNVHSGVFELKLCLRLLALFLHSEWVSEVRTYHIGTVLIDSGLCSHQVAMCLYSNLQKHSTLHYTKHAGLFLKSLR